METTPPSPPWADENKQLSFPPAFQWADVAGKAVTLRRALATGEALLTPSSYASVRAKTNPKGDVLALAEAAGLMATKRTAELIPLCHPLALNQARVHFELDDERRAVTVSCEVSAEAKTGVEMEALCGVTGALLTIYDLAKAVDPVITLSSIRLVSKEGGKHGTWRNPELAPVLGAQELASLVAAAEPAAAPSPALAPALSGLRAAWITVSDRAHEGRRADSSGPCIETFLLERGACIAAGMIVPDERDAIREAVLRAVAEKAALVVLTGGTGVGPRDLTPEVVQELCDRWIPGIGERLRASGAAFSPMSWLSRSGGGLRGKTLLIALPGSPRAVIEGLQALAEILPHALAIAAGGDHA